MSKNQKPAPIVDRFQLTTDKKVDQHNAARDQQKRANDHQARQVKDRAAGARQKLAQTPKGREAIARIDAIRSGTPDAETLTLVEAMERAERSAAATAENYVLSVGGLIEALHHCLPFSQELQKLAVDARQRLAAAHTVGPTGETPHGLTINGKGTLVASVVVYPTPSPTIRYVLDQSFTFDAIAEDVQEQCHCDASEEPFRKSLAADVPPGFKADCVAEMAEHASIQRTQTDYYERDMKALAPQWHNKLKRPDPISVGLLFPVAFGSDVLVLKLCHGHAWALVAQYGIQLRECGIEDPWESVGNYW